MWGAPLGDRLRFGRLARRDPRQARLFTVASLRWVLRNRAYTPWYLVRYWRLLRFRLANPHIVLRGMVFLGRGVDIHCRPGYGRMEIGRWVHIGDGNAIRCHEGSLRIGDKVVFGKDNTVNCYLDIEFGDAALVADWVYICDFDHVTADVNRPIKDQGIVKSPVRIGPDTWVGVKVSILRGTRVGRGCVLGANAVVRGDIPDYAIAVGMPARVVRNRLADYEADAERRGAVADMARKARVALEEARQTTTEAAMDDA
jgi:acetyltransferase-like isoleucine patch superfamily enzyme